MSNRVAFVYNPKSAGGATAKKLPKLTEMANARFDAVEVFQTVSQGDGINQAQNAMAWGADMVVAVGGDGTASEVVNGLCLGGDSLESRPKFGLVPAGTGSDLARTLDMPSNLDEAMAILASGQSGRADLLKVESGGQPRRFCVNVTGFGINGDVVRRANQSSKRLGGTATFLGAILRSLVSWTPREIELTYEGVDGSKGEWAGRFVGGFVANGAWCGGGLWIGRGGSICDGGFELLLVPALPKLTLIRNLPKLYGGTFSEVSGVLFEQVRSITVNGNDTHATPVEVDGESWGVLPLHVSIEPSALQIVAPCFNS